MTSTVANILFPPRSDPASIVHVETAGSNSPVNIEFAGQFEDVIGQPPQAVHSFSTSASRADSISSTSQPSAQPILVVDSGLQVLRSSNELPAGPVIERTVESSSTYSTLVTQDSFPRIYSPDAPTLTNDLQQNPSGFDDALSGLTADKINSYISIISATQAQTPVSDPGPASTPGTSQLAPPVILPRSPQEGPSASVPADTQSSHTTLDSVLAVATDIQVTSLVEDLPPVNRTADPKRPLSKDEVPATITIKQADSDTTDSASEVKTVADTDRIAQQTVQNLTTIIAGIEPPSDASSVNEISSDLASGTRPLQWTSLVLPLKSTPAIAGSKDSVSTGDADESETQQTLNVVPAQIADYVYSATATALPGLVVQPVAKPEAPVQAHQPTDSRAERDGREGRQSTPNAAVESFVERGPAPVPAQVDPSPAPASLPELDHGTITVVASQPATLTAENTQLRPNATIQISDQIEFAAEISVVAADETLSSPVRIAQPDVTPPSSTISASPVAPAVVNIPAAGNTRQDANETDEPGQNDSFDTTTNIPPLRVFRGRPAPTRSQFNFVSPETTEPITTFGVDQQPAVPNTTQRLPQTVAEIPAVDSSSDPSEVPSTEQPAGERAVLRTPKPDNRTSDVTLLNPVTGDEPSSNVDFPEHIIPLPGISEASAKAGSVVPAAETISTPVTGQIANRVAQELQLVRELDQPVRHISIRLDPPELGSLRIQIRSQSDGLHLQVEAAEDVTLEMLSTRVPEIEQLLRHQDIDISRLTVHRLESNTDSPTTDERSQDRTREQNLSGDGQPQGHANSGREQAQDALRMTDRQVATGQRQMRTGIRA